MSFEPKNDNRPSVQVVFPAVADFADTARGKYALNVRVARVMCAGRVETNFILKAFEKGVDSAPIAS
jgi:heterodisulfide reductase subunit A